MDFAKELANISVEIEEKLKIDETPKNQKNQKEEKVEKIEKKLNHVKNVSIQGGIYKNKIGFIKKEIPSSWLVSIPKRVHVKNIEFGNSVVKVGEEFVANNIKYKVLNEFDELIKIRTKNNDLIEVPSNDMKKLYLIEVKVEVKWDPEIESLYMNTFKRIPKYTTKLIVAEKIADKYKALKTQITQNELTNSIMYFEKMFGKNVKLLSKYISNVFDLSKVKANQASKFYSEQELVLSKLEDIIDGKVNQIRKKYEYASLELDIKNEESIENILKFELAKSYSFNVLKSFNYVNKASNQNFGVYGETVETFSSGKTLEYEEQVFLGSKDVVIKNKDVMNITIRKGQYKGYKPQIISFSPKRFILEIEGRIYTTLNNKEKGELIKPITKNQFIYNDVIFGESSFGEVLEEEDDILKVKTIEGKTVTLGKNEYTSNGFYITESKKDIAEEETDEVELIFEREVDQEEMEMEDEEITAESEVEEEEEEAIEELEEGVEAEEMLTGYKDVERITFKRDLTKDEEEIRKKLESLASSLKISIENVYPLIDEASLIFAKKTKEVKGSEMEEYFTLSGHSMKYIYALIVYRYLSSHGFKLYNVNSRKSFSELLEKKEYFKIQDYRKNAWYDSKQLKLVKENYSKIILEMLKSAEKFYVNTIGPINWNVQDPLKESREAAIALGYAGPSHLEVMTKEVRKGKDKNYEMYIIGKIHDEEQKKQAELDVANYFSMKEVSDYNKKNVLEAKKEISKKETWEDIAKIQQLKTYIIRKFSDKLKEEVKQEKNVELKNIKSEILKNIKKLDILIKETKDDKVREYATNLSNKIDEEIKQKIKAFQETSEKKNDMKKRKQMSEEKMDIDEEEESDIDDKIYDQMQKEKEYKKQFEEKLVKKPRKMDINTILNAPKETTENIIKFLSKPAEGTNIKVFDVKKKKYDEDFMEWNIK
jgi:hypothetical protein